MWIAPSPVEVLTFLWLFMTAVSLLNLRMPELIAIYYFATGLEYHEVFDLRTAFLALWLFIATFPPSHTW